MIYVEHLCKKYGEFVAVNDVSFSLSKAQTLVFLGPNGAGKTTIHKVLGCITPATFGSITIDKFNVNDNPIEIKEIIGVLPEHYSLYENLNGFTNLMFFSFLYGLEKTYASKRIEKLLAQFGLENDNKIVGNYSKGMKKKLALARSLLHNPKILLLDEPTSDLDPKSANELREFLINIRESDGITSIVCTHNLIDAIEFGNKIIVIANGKVLFDGELNDLVDEASVGIYATIIDTKSSLSNIPKSIYSKIELIKDKTYHICLHNNDCLQKLIKGIPTLNMQLIEIESSTKRLERAYIKLTNKNGGSRND